MEREFGEIGRSSQLVFDPIKGFEFPHGPNTVEYFRRLSYSSKSLDLSIIQILKYWLPMLRVLNKENRVHPSQALYLQGIIHYGISKICAILIWQIIT
jgi:hypothetical protein